MKIHVLSDLHLEFADFSPALNAADVIVLAGDIGLRSEGITWARKSFPNQEIIYVAGNHEFYGSQRSHAIERMRNASIECGIHFLDDDVLQLQDPKSNAPIRFLGATLWTDFLLFGENLKSKCLSYGELYLNDFRTIRDGGRDFSPKKIDSIT